MLSAPPVPHHRSNYSDSMWNTYITEAIQSGNHKQKDDINKKNNNTNTNTESDNDSSNEVNDSGDLAAELMKIHNEKYPDREVIHVSRSTLTRINQQYKLSSKRVNKRKHTMMSIDDSVITEYQSKLNDIFVIYEDHDLIMNSNQSGHLIGQH